METHTEGQGQGHRAADGVLRAGGGLGSSGAGAELGREVFLQLRGRGAAAEDTQDLGSGPAARGTQGQRHQWGPEDSQDGTVGSSAGTRSSPQQPWVLAGLTGKGGPKGRCRKRRAGPPPGRAPAGACLGQWGPWACWESGCRAKGRAALLTGAAAGAAGAAHRPPGVSPGGLGEQGAVGAVGGEEGCHQPAPGKPWASSSHPGASPHGPGANGTASSWRKSSQEMSPRAPRPPGTSQPWSGRQGPVTMEAS